MVGVPIIPLVPFILSLAAPPRFSAAFAASLCLVTGELFSSAALTHLSLYITFLLLTRLDLQTGCAKRVTILVCSLVLWTNRIPLTATPGLGAEVISSAGWRPRLVSIAASSDTLPTQTEQDVRRAHSVQTPLDLRFSFPPRISWCPLHLFEDKPFSRPASHGRWLAII